MDRFPVKDSDLAMALHTAGCAIVPDEMFHEHNSTNHLTWWIHGPAASVANGLVHAYQDPRRDKNLQTTDPAHPFLASIYTIETLRTLLAWLAGQLSSPPAIVRTPGPLLRCVPSAAAGMDLQHYYWHTGRPALKVVHPGYAAALITCGFPCYPQIVGDGTSPPALVFAEESLTFPGLFQTALARLIMAPPNALRTEALPGFLLGEHPFDYAWQAALNFGQIEAAARPARANPTIFIKGPGTGAVIASQSLLEESHPDSSFRDEAHKFLS